MKKIFLTIIVLSALCFGREREPHITTTFFSESFPINELLDRFASECSSARIDVSRAPVYTVTTDKFVARVVYVGNNLKVSYTYDGDKFRALRFHNKLIGFLDKE